MANSQIDCFYHPQNTQLPDGVALQFTHIQSLTSITGAVVHSWHFNLFPTTDFSFALQNIYPNRQPTPKNFNLWVREFFQTSLPCSMKAQGKIKKLEIHNDDYKGLKHHYMNHLFKISVCAVSDDIEYNLFANELYTWIKLKKPTLEDLFNNQHYSWKTFCFLNDIKLPKDDDTLESVRSGLIYEFKKRFNWTPQE
jgi:hypothetical protein